VASRREFLKTAALGVAGVSLVGIVPEEARTKTYPIGTKRDAIWLEVVRTRMMLDRGQSSSRLIYVVDDHPAFHWYVDPSGVIVASGLSTAVEAATDCDTLCLYRGTYLWDFRCEKSLTFLGMGEPGEITIELERPLAMREPCVFHNLHFRFASGFHGPLFSWGKVSEGSCLVNRCTLECEVEPVTSYLPDSSLRRV